MISGVKPLGLVRRTDAFDDTDWVFELKHDGFRALAYIDAATCRLVSRNQHRFDEFDALAKAIAKVDVAHDIQGALVELGVAS